MNLSLNEKLAYSTNESAALLSVSPKTVRRLIKEGRLHAVRIGSRRLLIPSSSIKRFLKDG